MCRTSGDYIKTGLVMPVLARTPSLEQLALRAVASAATNPNIFGYTIIINGCRPGKTKGEFAQELQDTIFAARERAIDQEHPRLPPPTFYFHHPADNLGVAASWNLGLRWCAQSGYDNAVVINADVDLSPDCIESLLDELGGYGSSIIEEAQGADTVIWCATDTTDRPDRYRNDEGVNGGDIYAVTDKNAFSVWATNLQDFWRTFPTGFDENFFPAYCEDNDILVRATHLGRKIRQLSWAGFKHTGSATLKFDQAARAANNRTFDRNVRYFQQKWGMSPFRDPAVLVRQGYPTPFNLGGGVNDWTPPPVALEGW